ncbi:Bro-N domain-containing protein, partial [Pediococcus acidilactici]
MNELQNFNFEGNEVRTVLINDEPYFVGKDIADILGYSNTSKAIRDHVDEED